MLMSFPINIAWLIPLLPFSGGFLLAILFVSFNRTMKRLSRPVAFIIISCALTSAILSYILLSNELSIETVNDISLNWKPFFLSRILHLELIINKLSSIGLSFVATLTLILMLLYHFSMNKKQGYIPYFILISIISSTLLGLTLTTAARETVSKFIA